MGWGLGLDGKGENQLSSSSQMALLPDCGHEVSSHLWLYPSN